MAARSKAEAKLFWFKKPRPEGRGSLLKDKDDYLREVTVEALAAETQALPC